MKRLNGLNSDLLYPGQVIKVVKQMDFTFNKEIDDEETSSPIKFSKIGQKHGSDKSLNIDLLKESAEEKKINMPKTDIDLKKKIDEEAELSKIRNLSSKYEIRCDVVTKMKKYIKGILEISSQFLIFGEIDDNIV